MSGQPKAPESAEDTILKEGHGNHRRWSYLLLTVFAGVIYVGLEWLFLATKPSFMTTNTFLTNLSILLIAPMPLYVICGVWAMLFSLAGSYIQHKSIRTIFMGVALLPAVMLVACSMLLLLDNFTYALFHYGIISTGYRRRFIYTPVFLFFLYVAYRLLRALHVRLEIRIPYYRAAWGAAVIFLTVSFVILSVNLRHKFDFDISATLDSQQKTLPNILFFAGDGINAQNTSLYGYFRDTTPFLKSFANDALVCDNAFSNAGDSGSSIVAMMTSKYATHTRLIYPPDILKGKDAYQHLPAILRQLGYRSIDISIRHYGDLYDMNMRNSFDRANFRELNRSGISGAVARFMGDNTFYFLNILQERIQGRLLHIFGIRLMQNTYQQVTNSAASATLTDNGRIEELLAFIDQDGPKPFFAHIHLMGTHGAKFSPAISKFSTAQEQTEPWMVDFYDDGISEVDQRFQQVIQHLKNKGQLENTIVIFDTDHGQKYTVCYRLPLLIRFPRGEHAGHLTTNVQKIDIAPTILDYLGVEKPDWMDGQSLISGTLNTYRPIFGIRKKYDVLTIQNGQLCVDHTKTGPPFYHLGYLSLIIGDKFFELDLMTGQLRTMIIGDHVGPIDRHMIPDPQRAGRIIVDHLAKNGYDISYLVQPFPVVNDTIPYTIADPVNQMMPLQTLKDRI